MLKTVGGGGGSVFIVESQNDNLKDVSMEISPEEVNEYATSCADLVMRKDGGKQVEQPVKLAVVSLDNVEETAKKNA